MASRHENLINEGYVIRADSRLNCFRVVKPNGEAYRVDVVERTCTCPASVTCCHLKQFNDLLFASQVALEFKMGYEFDQFCKRMASEKPYLLRRDWQAYLHAGALFVSDAYEQARRELEAIREQIECVYESKQYVVRRAAA